MPTYSLKIEYDGSEFAGWQTQPNGRSVQAVIEAALKQILQSSVAIVGGGRTDSGVHARGQVASFRMEKALDAAALQRSLNGVLPKDVIIRTVQQEADEFHARHSAASRRYRYTICRRPMAVGRAYVWQILYPLDVELMRRCAEQIEGDHDFQAFCKVDTEVAHFRCVVSEAKWKTEDDLLLFDVTANRFLYGMVRALVGTMVDVGRNHTPFDAFVRIMDSCERSKAGMAAPAQGLMLEEITYQRR